MNDNENSSTENTSSTENSTESTMAEKLVAAGQKAEAAKNARHARVVKGSHLLPKLKELIAVPGLDTTENTGFFKVNGGVKNKNVLIAKKGGRVDLSGFVVEAAAVRQLSEQEAREKHLGKVRGQIDFNLPDEQVLEAFSAALAELKTTPPQQETAVPSSAPTDEA